MVLSPSKRVVFLLQAGNDFLPNVPSIDIYDKPCGLDLLFTAYKALLPKMGGHITGARAAAGACMCVAVCMCVL
jgi:5'-3' exonuclease